MKDKKGLCKRRIYRCKLNSFIGKDGSYNEQIKMYPMKRLSCPGCEYCEYIPDALNDSVSCETMPIINNPLHGQLYRLEITNPSRDWETGIVDDYDIEFIKHEGKENEHI